VIFFGSFPTKQYEPGEVIVHQGDKVAYVHIIQSGLIKVYDINKDGEEKLITYDGKNEIFPIAWAFSRATHSLYFYEAYSVCKISLISHEEYMAFLMSHPQAMFMTLQIMAERYVDFSRRVNSLTQLKAEDKILYSLDFLCRRFGKGDLSKVQVQLPLSQQELANFVGLTRETVSTTMNKLRAQGVVSYKNNNGLEINTKKIEKLVSM
jgi:CRP/FNR family transcriptional regulator